MDGSKSYNVNFFKPSTPFLKANIRAIVIGLSIWAVATYGFHILLKVIETPTPEPGYIAYQQIAPKLAAGTASSEEKVAVAKVYLDVLGKSAALVQNDALKSAFTSTLHELLPEPARAKLIATATQAETDKGVKVGFINAALGITENKPLMAVVPYALIAIDPQKMATTAPAIEPILKKYLVHNQSVLTDTIVFGFPFHYLYTALFLLILYVVICVVYCQVIDKLMKKHGLETAEAQE